VLRWPRASTAAYLDRAAEAHNAHIATELGLAPQIVFFDPADGLMLTRFVEGAVPLSAEALRGPERLRAVVALLRRLHGSGRRFCGEMHLFAMLDRYMALAGRDAPQAASLAAARNAARPVQEALEAHPDAFVPCHIDPTPPNFLAAPDRLYLVDWEYAAMSEPLWDVAALSIEAGLDAAGDAELLRLYLTAPSSRAGSRFVLIKAMLDLLAAAWAAVQIVQGNDSADFAADVRARLARVEAALADPALAERLAAAR
jgi:thiamine kinase-like enzyme